MAMRRRQRRLHSGATLSHEAGGERRPDEAAAGYSFLDCAGAPWDTAEHIPKLRTLTYPAEGTGDESCQICLVPYTTGELLHMLPCKHCFHESCLRSWFERQSNCPTCRWNGDTSPRTMKERQESFALHAARIREQLARYEAAHQTSRAPSGRAQVCVVS